MVWEIICDVLRLTVLAGLGAAGVLAILIWKRNRMTRVSLIRFIVQLVASAAIFYLFSYTIPMLYVLLGLFVMSLFLGRFFCGWLCPFALIMDIESFFRRALKVRYRVIPNRLNVALHKARYVILLFFFLTPLLLWFFDPQEIMVSPMMANLLAGHYRPYAILLDPLTTLIVSWTSQLELFGIYLNYPYVENIVSYTGAEFGQIFAVAFVVVTLIGGFFIRRSWCRFCPTGASLAVLNRFGGFKWAPLLHIEKDEEKCTKCGVCKRVCTVQVNEVYEQKSGKIATSQCMVCGRCVELCPYEDALKIKLGNKTLFRSRNWLEPSNSE